MTLKAIFLHGMVVIDGWLVSSLSESAVGAMGLAVAIGGIILGTIFAFAHAMQIRAAQAYGTGDPVFIKSVLASGLTISLGIGCTGGVLLLCFGDSFIDDIAPSKEVASHAWSYLSIFVLVVLFEAVGQCLSSYFNGIGRTRIPLYGYLISVPINVIVSIALIHGLWGLPAFGISGAAMGSAFASLLQALFFMLRLYQSDRHLLRVRGWRHGRFITTLGRHIRFALPIAATFVSATLATHVCTMIYAGMSLTDFAALALIAPWNLLVGQLSMQWTQATGILVAQLLGRGATEKTLDRFLSTAWRGAFASATLVSLVFIALCSSVNFLYSDLTAETRATLFSFLPILVLASFPRATNAICGNTLRASGDTVYVMHIFVWSQWLFRVPTTVLAVMWFEATAPLVLSLMLAEEVIKFFPFHRRLWTGKWKQIQLEA
ncbi:MAG: polysaccharide biosynthesis C-terminal domain-containing protein [Shimia sp.]|uniref:MATE family efflux transporter n=1 Tax=Shimia sp. TaxID=1954381 RepID=UPI003B8BD9DA